MSNYLYTLDNKILQHKGLTVDLVGVNPIWNGLIHYWGYNETSGTAVADSVANNKFNGTLSNAAAEVPVVKMVIVSLIMVDIIVVMLVIQHGQRNKNFHGVVG